MRTHQGITDAITAFKAFRGKATAKDAKTGEEAPVETLQDLSDGSARLIVRLAGREALVFEGDYVNGPNGLGRYFNLNVVRPRVPDCEPTSIEILDYGNEDYPVHAHGSGSWDPTLALTLFNEGAEERNAPIIAAYEAEQRRKEEERSRRLREESRRSEIERHRRLEERAEEISSFFVGERVRALRIDAYTPDHVKALEFKLDDGTTVRIRARHDHSLEIERL